MAHVRSHLVTNLSNYISDKMIKKELIIVLSVLIILTITIVLLTNINANNILILSISIIKIILVALYFMELKIAHLFWKMSIIVTIIAIIVSSYCISL